MTFNVQAYYTQNNRTYGKSTGFTNILEAITMARRWSYAYNCILYCGTTALFYYKNGKLI